MLREWVSPLLIPAPSLQGWGQMGLRQALPAQPVQAAVSGLLAGAPELGAPWELQCAGAWLLGVGHLA